MVSGFSAIAARHDYASTDNIKIARIVKELFFIRSGRTRRLRACLVFGNGNSESVMILSRNMLKRMGDSRHPCRTPTVVRNQSPMLLLKRTALVALLKRFLMTQVRLVLAGDISHIECIG